MAENSFIWFRLTLSEKTDYEVSPVAMENFGMSPELGRKSICNLECSDVLDPSYDKSSSKNIERSIIPGLHKVYPIPSKVYKTKKKLP